MDIKNSTRKTFDEDEEWNGQASKTHQKPTIKVNYNVPAGSLLRVYQSPSGHTWNYDEYSVSGFGSREVGVSGSHYYTWFKSGADAQAVISTYLIETINDEFGVSVVGMQFNADGELLVSSSGGGTGGDASAANQTASNLAVCTRLDTINTSLTGTLTVDTELDLSGLATSANQDLMLSNLASIDISCNNMEILLDNLVFSNNGNLHVLDAASVAVLENIYTAAGDTAINTTPIAYSPVHLDLETQGAIVWADSTVDWFAPLNHEQGWQYDNTTIGGANVYFYSNTGLAIGGIEPDFTLGSLMNMSFVANYRLLLDSNSNKKFYIALTTKPTGTNDYYPGVFHSRKVWQLPSSTVISKGADYLFYAMDDITSFRRDLDHKQMTLALSNGDCAPEEIVQFMSINVDSGTTVNQFSGIVKQAYFSTAGGTNRQVVFDNSISRKAELNLSQLTVGMGTLQVNMAGFTFNGDDELLVTRQSYVDIRSSGIDLTHTTNGAKECLDVSVDNIVACDTGAVVVASGSITVSGDIGLVQGSQVNLIDSVVGLVENTTLGIVGDVAVVSGATALNVTETAPITGFSLETTQTDIKTQTDKLTFIDVDANTNNLKVIDLEANNKLGQFSFFTNDDTATDLRVRVMNPIEVLNPEGGTLAVSGNVGLVAESVVGVQNTAGTSLDVHCFASSNGTDYHHIKSTATGELVVHSQLFNSSSTAITTTPNGGITALDVAVSGTAVVSGVVDSRAQEAYMPSVITSTNVTGPVQIGTVVDTQHFLWISAILQFSSITAGGNIYLEVSPDSSMWARPSGAQVFINTSITTTTAAILLSSPVSMRYVRLWADTGFIGVSGTAYVCCK